MGDKLRFLMVYRDTSPRAERPVRAECRLRHQPSARCSACAQLASCGSPNSSHVELRLACCPPSARRCHVEPQTFRCIPSNPQGSALHGGTGCGLCNWHADRWHEAWGEDHVIARTDRYRFNFHGRDGELKRVVSMAREPLAMTEEDRSLFLWRWDELARKNNAPADRWAEIKSTISFADTYPPYACFRMGPAGTLLVQRVWPVRDLDAEGRKDFLLRQQYVPPGSTEWDVFDREGRHLGAVAIPGSEFITTEPLVDFFQDAATGTWHMYSVVSDELGVQYIVGWRIDGRMPEDIEVVSPET